MLAKFKQLQGWSLLHRLTHNSPLNFKDPTKLTYDTLIPCIHKIFHFCKPTRNKSMHAQQVL